MDNPPTKIFLKWTSRAIDYKSNAFNHRNSLNMKWVWSEVKWVWNGRYSEQSSTWNADCTTPNQRVSFLPNVISSACSSNHFAVHSFSRTPERNWFLLEQATDAEDMKSPGFSLTNHVVPWNPARIRALPAWLPAWVSLNHRRYTIWAKKVSSCAFVGHLSVTRSFGW